MSEPSSRTAADGASPAPLRRLVDDVLTGREGAWPALVGRLHPLIVALGRRRGFSAGPGREADTWHDVALATIERLGAGEHAVLRAFRAASMAHPGTGEEGFVRWIQAVASNVYIDYLRGLPEIQRRRAGGGRVLERVTLAPLDDRPGEAVPYDAVGQVEIARIMERLLDASFPPAQRQAIGLWLRGYTSAEIAIEMGLDDPAEGARLLRTARQRLRRTMLGGVR